MAYRLVEFEGRPCLKLSAGKQSLVGGKQVPRWRDANGRLRDDVIGTRDEPSPGPEWEPLLPPVMERGVALPRPSLADCRANHQAEMAALPDSVRALNGQVAFPVATMAKLARRQPDATQQVLQRAGLENDGPSL